MALNKTNVPISFAYGLDTKTDKKQTVLGRLTELENGVFTKAGAISKRNGYEVLGTQEMDDTDIEEGSALSVFKNELALFTGTKMLSYAESNDKWADKGRVVSVLTEGRRIIQNNNEQSVPAVATNQGVTVYAWEDSSGGIRVSTLDHETGNYLLSNQQISASGIHPKCVALNRTVYIFYIESTTLKYKKINTSDPTTVTASVDFSTTIDGTNKHYDVLNIGSRLFVAWNNSNASTGISLQYMTSTEIFSDITEYVGEEASSCITLLSDDDENAWVAYHDGSDLKAFVWDYALDNEILAETVIETVASVVNLTGVVVDTTATFYYEISSANSYNHLIRKNTLTLSGTAGSASVFVRSVGLAAKAFQYAEATYLLVTHESVLQSTYFLVNSSGEIVAKISHQLGGGLTDKSILSDVAQYETGIFIFASQIKGKLESEDGNVFTRRGINSTVVDFVSNNRFQSAVLGDNLHIAGGVLNAYDGSVITEHGFHVFPENVTATPGTSGGSVADGTYQACVVYEWIDNYGQIHRSAPSIPVTAVVSGGSGSGKVTLSIPTLRLTRKVGVNVVIYATEDAGSVFYRVNSISSPLANDPTADTVSYEITSVTSLISNEPLYTNGGTLENISAPGCTLLAQFNNRIAYVPSENQNSWGVSKERQEGEPVNFSDALLYKIESKGGDVGAFGVLDDKLILFKKVDGIYWVTGNGPTDAGTDDDFTKPQAVPSDVGCNNPNSVVLTPAGLMFKSNKGIYLLDRSLTVTYIGAPVEDYNDLTITGSSLVPNTNQVRFITSDGSALVYDYLFGQWSTFTNHEGEDCVIWDTRFVFLKSNGKVFKETPDTFTDDNQAIKLRLVTSWLSMAGIQGFQRAYRLMILGDYKSDHKLIVKVGYNFNEYFTQEVTIDTGSLLDNPTYGEDSPYGDSEVYGGEYRLYQFRIHLQTQKCQSIRFSIEDFQLDNFGEGFSISNFALEVGAKKGLYKKESGRSFGTE